MKSLLNTDFASNSPWKWLLLRLPFARKNMKLLQKILLSLRTSSLFNPWLYLLNCPWLLKTLPSFTVRRKLDRSSLLSQLPLYYTTRVPFTVIFFKPSNRRDPTCYPVLWSYHLPSGSNPFQNAPEHPIRPPSLPHYDHQWFYNIRSCTCRYSMAVVCFLPGRSLILGNMEGIQICSI